MPRHSTNNAPPPRLPASAHFIGIGGIGMSSIAAAFAWMGVRVSGSDRKLDGENESGGDKILDALRRLGIRLFPQDGSFAKFHEPEILVRSSAIEPGNPDAEAAEKVPAIHRSEALNAFLAANQDKTSIAVCGTSGKTTTTAWLAETLHMMGEDPVVIGGGIALRFENSRGSTGNFKPGKGKFIVFEADESDKSLAAYAPNAAVLLNMGSDHHPLPELAEIFSRFLNTAETRVIQANAAAELANLNHPSNPNIVFHDGPPPETQRPPYPDQACWNVEKYVAGNTLLRRTSTDSEKTELFHITSPVPGRHSASNAMAVMATIDALGLDLQAAARNIPLFKGVWRRFNRLGTSPSGAAVIDDYAHNPEKIAACLNAARETIPANSKIIAIFQPHGFKPLAFMKNTLLEALEATLRPNDAFAFLPVHYAGGSAAFTPTSKEVVEEFSAKGRGQYLALDSREEAKLFVEKTAARDDAVLVMGARDDSLANLAETFVACQKRNES